jgi:high-affinity iron transporter
MMTRVKACGKRLGQERGRSALGLACALALIAFAPSPSLSEGASPPWSSVAVQISETLDRAATAHASQQSARGTELVSEAYFGAFEESGMEIAIRQYVSARRARELERMFGGIRQAIATGAESGEIRRQIAALREALETEAVQLERHGVTPEDIRQRPEGPEPTGADGAAEPVPSVGSAPLLARLGEVGARYTGGARDEARGLLDSAYFDEFEARGLEAAIGARAPARKAAIEARFVRIRSLMAAGAPPEAVAGEIEALRIEIGDAVALLTHNRGRWQTILGSTFIIVREGFEAILILTALVTYLAKAGHHDRVRIVYQAAGAAVAASLFTALGLRFLVGLAPGHQESLEGVSMLAAAAVLVYVSYWLTSRTEGRRWQAYLRSKVQDSLGTGRIAALWAAAFLAVYREGAETVLFYQALLAGTAADTRAILAGLGIGTLGLAALFVVLRSGARRVPMHAFFAWTSFLLYSMALIFVGRGVRALQTAGAVGASPTPWQLTLDWVGLYPTWESVAGQMVLLGAAAVALVVGLAGRGRSGQEGTR